MFINHKDYENIPEFSFQFFFKDASNKNERPKLEIKFYLSLLILAIILFFIFSTI